MELDDIVRWASPWRDFEERDLEGNKINWITYAAHSPHYILKIASGIVKPLARATAVGIIGGAILAMYYEEPFLQTAIGMGSMEGVIDLSVYGFRVAYATIGEIIKENE